MSGHRDDEAVDAFGRTVVATATSPRTNGRTVVAANPVHRDVRVVESNAPRGRTYSNVQHDDRSRDYHQQDGGYRQQNQNYQQSRGGGGGQSRNIRYQDNRDGYNSGKRHQQSNYNPVPSNRIPPIMSFKSFMQAQHDDLPPEVFQRMYDQYHLLYLQDFSDSFFKASMVEEWFQDRYNPIRIYGLEEASAARAVTESASMKASLVAHPKESVKAMCLDPPPNPNRKRAPTIGDAAAATVEDATDEHKPAEASNDVMVEDNQASNVLIATKHLPGHEDRTLYISGIHAGCTKASLETAINSALTAVDETLVAERIIIAQPVWTNTHGVDKFERFAWVVMPTVNAAKQALKELGDLKVDVFEPLEPEDREPVVSFTFTVHAKPHHPKLFYENNIHCAHHLRVEADTVRALELAELLDDERKVPAESRLAAILEEPAVQAALVKPTDKLDVSIAYLRRVHFLNFYLAKRYRDEAHMLSMGPSVPYRVKEYVPPPLPTDAMDSGEQERSEEAVVAAPSGGKRKRDEEEEVEEGEAGTSASEAVGADAAAGGMEVEGATVKPPAPTAKRPAHVPIRNPRIDALLAELRQKRAQAVQRLENPELLGSADEEEAKTLAAIQEQSFDRCVEAKLKLEKEGKCRCCYVTCSKLFKGVDFLTKHMHLKHPEFSADVLLKDAEPFMKKRFDAEPMGARPLPPVEVETHGHTELKSVKEILDKYMAAVAAGGHAAIASARRDQNTANPRRHSGGDGQEFRKRGQDDRDRRASGGSAQHSNKQNGGQMQYMEPRSEDNFARKISSYIDVDAPKESAVSIDYGVALPPIKKRKTVAVVKKVTEPAPAV